MTEPSTPLWKQLLGAAGGAMVALVLYGAYDIASPLFGSVQHDSGAVAQAEEAAAEEARGTRMEEIAARARVIAQEMRAGWYVPTHRGEQVEVE